MKIALIADIHGNTIALEAVLADAAHAQPDLYLFLGDIVDGPDPAGVLAQIVPLPNARFIYGNTDRYIITGKGPAPYALEDIPQHLDKLPVFQQATASWGWAKGYLCATGWFDWLCELPRDIRLDLPSGQRLLAVHASPGYADGPGVGPHVSDEQLAVMVKGCGAEVICIGHTHVPFVRTVDGVTVVNAGSVSNPLAPDFRASYALLFADEENFSIKHRRVDYDRAAFCAAVRASHHPSIDYILGHQEGKHTVESMGRAAQARWSMLKEFADTA